MTAFSLGTPPRAYRVHLKDGSWITFTTGDQREPVITISAMDLITKIESSVDGNTFDWVYRKVT